MTLSQQPFGGKRLLGKSPYACLSSEFSHFTLQGYPENPVVNLKLLFDIFFFNLSTKES
jgi:hypothetical protein